MQRIVAAVDHSEPSLRAADLAADLAGRYDAELMVLIVGHDIGVPDPGMDAYARLEHIREPTSALHVEALRDGLAGVCDRAKAAGARRVTAEAVVGEPAEQILAYAGAEQADLIVVGSRGHGRLAGLLLGSVAQKVVALAGCPVLVVR